MDKIRRTIHSAMGRALVVCTFALALLGGTSAAFYSRESASTEYTKLGQNNLIFSPIDYPNAKATGAGDINGFGHIVGAYVDNMSKRHGFIWKNGLFSPPLDYPEASSTEASGINDLGQIVGRYTDSDQKQHGFLYYRGVFTTVTAPGREITGAFGINNDGEIVGDYQVGSTRHGYRLKNGVFTPIHFQDAELTAELTNATSINDVGQIVGYFNAENKFHGFLLDDSGFSRIDVPDEPQTAASAINNDGQIVGQCGTSPITPKGFLFDNLMFTKFNYPNARTTLPQGINDRDQIVGSFTFDGVISHGFVASPPRTTRNNSSRESVAKSLSVRLPAAPANFPSSHKSQP
jgi:probable HAF family extracellular repeat protein